MKIRILIMLLICFQINVSAQDKLKIGDQAPAILIKHYLKNKPADTDLKNKYILLEFWATWCTSCLKETPKINSLTKKYANRRDIRFISITHEKPEKTKATLSKVEFNSIVVSDDTSTTLKNFIADEEGGYSIPKTILIDPNGIIRWVGTTMKLNPELFAKFLANKTIIVADETPFDIPAPTFTKN